MAEEETEKEEEKEEEEKKIEDDPVKEAGNILKGMNEANKERKEILAEEKELYARQMVRGKTQAGGSVEKSEETPKEYNDRIEKELAEGKHDD